MKRSAVVCVVCLGAGLSARAAAQQPVASSEESKPSWMAGLPAWLRLGVELRGRAEFNLGPDQQQDDRVYLNRLRLRLTVSPSRWVRFHLEGQDARAFRPDSGPRLDGPRNAFDVRQGYVEFGTSEQGFQARAGRQDLSVGDERLLGADNEWDPLGQTFDAVRMTYSGRSGTVEAFSGFRVEPGRRRPDPFDRSRRIAGLTARLKSWPGDAVLEPYVLWKRGGDSIDLLDRPGHRDVATPGVRSEGALRRGFDYNVEVALQRGHVVRDVIGAWAGHWEIGWRPLGAESELRVGFEYNHASGDSNPADGRHGTFDDLYPAGFNAYGIPDPFAWRNIRYPGIGVEVPLTRRWTVSGGWRAYRLTTLQDGLYAGGDTYLARNPDAGSSAIGAQVFLSTQYAPTRRWRLHAGYGQLLPGGFLRLCECPVTKTALYVLTSYAF